jgi:hypothetical protein
MEVTEMKLGEKIRMVFVIIGVCLMLYVPAWAVINRIVGGNIVAGDGLILGVDDPDTMHVLTGWTVTIDNDSVAIDTTNLWALFTIGRIESTWIVDGGIGAADLHANAVGNAQCEQIDSTWITDGSVGTHTIKDGGIFGEDIAAYTIDSSKITNTVVKVVRGVNTAAAQWKTNHVLLEGGTDITLDASDSSIKISYSGAGGNYDQFWPDNPAGMAVSWGTVDMDVFFPISEKFGDVTHPYFVRSVTRGTADDKVDTVVFSGRLPLAFNSDIDSITFAYRTSTTTAANAGVTWQVFAMADLSGFATADTIKMNGDLVASSGAGVWEWLSVPIADSAQEIGAGSWIFVYAICGLDYTTQAETVDVATPLFWGSAK